MDKSKVVSILTPFSPPLAPSQVEAIAAEITLVSAEELATVSKAVAEAPTKIKPLPVPKRLRKSKLRK